MNAYYRTIRPLAFNGQRIAEKGTLCEIVKAWSPKSNFEIIRIAGHDIRFSSAMSAKAFGRGAAYVTLLAPACACGNADASWRGERNGQRQYACAECWQALRLVEINTYMGKPYPRVNAFDESTMR